MQTILKKFEQSFSLVFHLLINRFLFLTALFLKRSIRCHPIDERQKYNDQEH